MMRIVQEGSRLAIYGGCTQLWIDPWGTDGVRIRMTNEPQMDGNDWALTEPVADITPAITWEEVDTTDPWYKTEEFKHYQQTGRIWTFTTGKLTVKVNPEGWLSFDNQKGELLTEEYWRNRNRINRYSVSLRIPARELKCIPGTNDFALAARFEAFDDEMIFGMGQYQDKHLNKKGATLELCHRNCQASVPFYVSSRGYGLRHQPHRMDGPLHEKDGLLHHLRRHPRGHRAQLHHRHGPHADDARVRPGLLAVQAALPHAGRIDGRGPQAQGHGPAAGRHRGGLLPLDPPG